MAMMPVLSDFGRRAAELFLLAMLVSIIPPATEVKLFG
jgi:hypothetical protein